MEQLSSLEGMQPVEHPGQETELEHLRRQLALAESTNQELMQAIAEAKSREEQQAACFQEADSLTKSLKEQLAAATGSFSSLSTEAQQLKQQLAELQEAAKRQQAAGPEEAADPFLQDQLGFGASRVSLVRAERRQVSQQLQRQQLLEASAEPQQELQLSQQQQQQQQLLGIEAAAATDMQIAGPSDPASSSILQVWLLLEAKFARDSAKLRHSMTDANVGNMSVV